MKEETMGTKKTIKKTSQVAEAQAAYGVTKASKKEIKANPPDIIHGYKSAYNSSPLDVIELIRDGISQDEFAAIQQQMPFSVNEWASFLQVSERTLQRNQKDNRSFAQVQSERIMELGLLYRFGVEVFGDEENLNAWLTAKSPALGGATPRQLLDTQIGIITVKDELGRIQHGILA